MTWLSRDDNTCNGLNLAWLERDLEEGRRITGKYLIRRSHYSDNLSLQPDRAYAYQTSFNLSYIDPVNNIEHYYSQRVTNRDDVTEWIKAVHDHSLRLNIEKYPENRKKHIATGIICLSNYETVPGDDYPEKNEDMLRLAGFHRNLLKGKRSVRKGYPAQRDWFLSKVSEYATPVKCPSQKRRRRSKYKKRRSKRRSKGKRRH